LIARLHRRKTQAYTAAVQDGQAQLRPGVRELIDAACAEGVAVGIVTTTSSENVEALMRRIFGVRWRERFAVVEDASSAPRKKPHPQAYLQALGQLRLGARCCLAIEDSFNGVEAARAAGIPVLVTPCPWTQGHDFSGADWVVQDLGDLRLAQLTLWAAQGFPRPPALQHPEHRAGQSMVTSKPPTESGK
jgi:HAD superfamily hydrolase (TIGR01509 family)